MYIRRPAARSIALQLGWLCALLPLGAGRAEGEAVAVAGPAEAPVAKALPAPEDGAPPDSVKGLPELPAVINLPAPELPGPVLSLPEALRLALERHPQLAALGCEIEAAEGRAWQALIKPNPEFDAEISEFMGTAETRGLRSATLSFGISQLVERASKRCARLDVAVREGELAGFELERARLDIMLAVSDAYYNCLVAQERLGLAAQREALAQQVYDAARLRFEGGKVARLDLTRVELDLAAMRLKREQAARQQAQAMARLLSLWGGSPQSYGSVAGQLGLPEEAPRLEPLLDAIEATPELRRWAAEEELRRARQRLACAEGEPDFTWSGGIERFEESDSLGLRLGLSFPLRKHMPTEGSVAEAQAYVEQVAELRAAEARRLAAELTSVHAEMAEAYSQAQAVASLLLPAALETFELTQLGYRYGKLSLLDVLDAERSLIDIRDQYFEALAAYQLAAVRAERLIAQPGGLSSGPAPAGNIEISDEETHHD